MLNSSHEMVGPISIIQLEGELDGQSAPDLEKFAMSLITQYAHRKLLLDFSGLQFVSSAGLRTILALMKKLKELQGSLAVCSMAPHIEQVFQTSGFIRLFTVFPSRDAALQAAW